MRKKLIVVASAGALTLSGLAVAVPALADQGLPVETLVDALMAAGQERIADAVENGRLTQEEADERLADLEEQITERVESAMPAADGHGPRGHRGGPAGDDVDPIPAD